MAVRRPENEEDRPLKKRQKTFSSDKDPRDNPYLAHHYAENNFDGSGNGYLPPHRRQNNAFSNGSLAGFRKHQTTAAQARAVEDGDVNPFTDQAFSKRYTSILQKRRDLPVQAQRCVKKQNL